MGRRPCCDKDKVKRGSWSPEEDATLKNYLLRHGGTAGNWIALPREAGLQRCGKSCRLRWLNYLRPDIKRGAFTQEEEDIICNLYCQIGSRWSAIASNLPGRTDNDVKNYWNTKLKKKLNWSTTTTSATTVGKHAAAAAAAFKDSTGSAFPVPLQPDLKGLPRSLYILQGPTNDGSSRANSTREDSNSLGPFSLLGMDYDERMKEITALEQQYGLKYQDKVFGDADLFSIFHVDCQPKGVWSRSSLS